MLGSILLLAATVATKPDMGVSISPAAVSAPGNAGPIVSQFRIADAGNIPEHLVIQVATTRPVKGSKTGAVIPFGEYDHYQVSVPEFTLNPGQFKMITVTVENPDHYAKTLAVVAESSITSDAMTRVHASVAARLTVTGQVAPTMPKPLSVPVPTLKPSNPTGVIAGAFGACAAILLTLGLWLRRRAHRKPHMIP
jgi:hypothetical protein